MSPELRDANQAQNSYDYIHFLTYSYYIYAWFPILYLSVLVLLWKEEKNPLDFSKKEGELKAQHCEEIILPWQLLKLWNNQKNIRQIHVKKSLYKWKYREFNKVYFHVKFVFLEGIKQHKKGCETGHPPFSPCIPAVCGKCWSPALHWYAPVPRALTTKHIPDLKMNRHPLKWRN